MTHRIPVPPQPVHAVERYLALAAAVDAVETVREFAIPLGPEHRAIALGMLANLPRPWVVLHPAARWETKLWEIDRWRSLAGSLASDGAGVVLTGAAGDAGMTARIGEGLDPAPRSLAGRLSLKELAAVLEMVDCMITVDSGPMHIAAAVGTPVVALFGATDPRRTGPLGAGTILQRSLPCSPCLLRRCRIAETRKCMRDLSVEEVRHAVRSVLDTGRREARHA